VANQVANQILHHPAARPWDAIHSLCYNIPCCSSVWDSVSVSRESAIGNRLSGREFREAFFQKFFFRQNGLQVFQASVLLVRTHTEISPKRGRHRLRPFLVPGILPRQQFINSTRENEKHGPPAMIFGEGFHGPSVNPQGVVQSHAKVVPLLGVRISWIRSVLGHGRQKAQGASSLRQPF